MPARVYSVSELNGFIQRLFESNSFLKRVSVEGEISNLTRASSGHLYFSLKDSNSEIRCIMWRSTAQRLKFNISDGMNVKVSGAVQVYAQRGQYSIIVSSMQAAGIGTLYQIYTQRLEELNKQGYFNPELKQPLPEQIKTVGVVTSETGAVIHDIITTIKRLDPTLEILLVPAAVQGEEAKESIVSGIEILNDIDRVDVIIVGRGGGSIEDLWAFNELEVAEAIHNSKKPVISSVGHETDVTISDMVADLRAPTPTAAAEIVSFGYSNNINCLENLTSRIIGSILDKYNKDVDRLNRLTELIRRSNPENKLTGYQFKLDELDLKIHSAIEKKLSAYENRLEALKLKTELLNPSSILERGYVIVTNDKGKLVKTTKQAKQDHSLNLHFYDGIQHVVTEDNE